MPVDPLWNSTRARELAAQRRPGALIRLGREHRAALEVGVPRHVLVSSLAPPTPTVSTATRVTASPHAEEDPMRRRTLLTATAAAGPAALLLGVDEALADTPAPTGAGPLDARLAAARDLYDKGTHAPLLAALPGLIADGHAAASSRRELDQARLSSVYSLAAAVLSKLGSYEQARLTADRARTWAEVSGSPSHRPPRSGSWRSCYSTRIAVRRPSASCWRRLPGYRRPDCGPTRRRPRTRRCSAPWPTPPPAADTAPRPSR